MIIGYDGSKLNWQHKTGTEHYASILFSELTKIDQRNIYRLYLRQPLTDVQLPANVEPTVIPWPRLWTQAGLATEVWRHQPDLLFIPAHTLPIIHRPSLKTVVTIHDLGYEYLPQYHQFPGRLYLNRTTEFAVRHATHLLAVSEFTKQDLIHKLNANPNHISVVYEGVNLDQFQPATPAQVATVRKKYHLENSFILFVGTIQPRKNLVRLIQAFHKLQRPDLDLVIAGGKGWLSDDIFAEPAKLQIESQVKFLGYVDEGDKASLYSAAELTALVSLFEGFGLPLLESMACGTPVVAANTASLPEVVGSAGVLVDPENVTAISEGLDQILTDPDLRQTLIPLGKDQADRFSWQQTAQQTLAVFEKVVA